MSGDVIRGGFLSADDRRVLTGLARDGLAEHRVGRRANAIVLLDQSWNWERVAAALLLDDDTVRDWYRAYEQGGVAGLKSFGHEGSSGHLKQRAGKSVERVGRRPLSPQHPKDRAFLKRTFGVSYSRSGLIALLHPFERRHASVDPVNPRFDRSAVGSPIQKQSRFSAPDQTTQADL